MADGTSGLGPADEEALRLEGFGRGALWGPPRGLVGVWGSNPALAAQFGR